MSLELEEGYLLKIYTEPIYLVGYERMEVVSATSIAENTPLEKPIEKLVEKSKPVLEVKSIPVMPKLNQVATVVSKKCVLLFSSEENELSALEMEFCKSIMKACGVGPEEFVCVNFKGININHLKERYEFKKLVLFGVEIPPLTLEKYQCTLVKSTYIISADPLWILQENKELKTFLWKQLQVMFGLVK